MRASAADGYFEVRRPWISGDTLDLDLAMGCRVLEANPQVEETLNEVAIQRGPIVYCLESSGLPHGISPLEVLLSSRPELVACYDQRLLSGVVVLEGSALARSAPAWEHQLYREIPSTSTKTVSLHLAPYFAWGNRAPSEMTVWIPRSQF